MKTPATRQKRYPSVQGVAATALLLFAHIATAQPAKSPAGATAICKDGSYTNGIDKETACHGHKGIQTWYKADAPSLAPPVPATSASLPTPVVVPASHALPTPTPATTATLPVPAPRSFSSLPVPTSGTSPTEPIPSVAATPPSLPIPNPSQVDVRYGIANERSRILAAPPAPGGGPGLVWLNTATKVYHCANSDFYGKTKNGTYTTESDATAQGAHPNRNKPCS